jgi:hypothetical protein
MLLRIASNFRMRATRAIRPGLRGDELLAESADRRVVLDRAAVSKRHAKRRRRARNDALILARQ